jgi:hypothetical protein
MSGKNIPSRLAASRRQADERELEQKEGYLRRLMYERAHNYLPFNTDPLTLERIDPPLVKRNPRWSEAEWVAGGDPSQAEELEKQEAEYLDKHETELREKILEEYVDEKFRTRYLELRDRRKTAEPLALSPIVNLERMTIALGDKTYDLTSMNALRWVKVLADHPGEWITAPKLILHDKELDGCRPDRHCKPYLPLAVLALIDSDRRKGSRLRLP